MHAFGLWCRGILFTILVPGMVGGYIPWRLAEQDHGVVWPAGWALIAAGAALYLWCIGRFLLAGGTPNIFFARHLSFLIGTEPPGLVSRGPYRYSRNPMYVGVLLAVFGQAVLFRSWRIAVYGACCWAFFHLIVVLVEEPHLKRLHGARYEEFLRSRPRWFGLEAGN